MALLAVIAGAWHNCKMTVPEIKSPKQVNNWLSDKPTNWKELIYCRSALRALPTMATTSESWLRFHAVSIFRANLVAWTALSDQDIDCRDSATRSQRALREAQRRAYTDSIASEAIFGALGAVMVTAGEDADHLFDWKDNIKEISENKSKSYSDLFEFVEKDVHWLLETDDYAAQNPNYAKQELFEQQLGLTAANFPDENWHSLWNTLIRFDEDYGVWIDWYERRALGHRAAFDIPGDKHRIEDKKILRRLAEATDEDFWGKGHEYVNTTLKSWLEEARARVAPPPPETELETPPQEPGAIAYGVSEQGKLDRLPHSDQVHLRDVLDQRRSYADLRSAALELLEEGQRLGPRLQPKLDRFLHSLPERFADAEAYLVWRDGNALRRIYRAHREVANGLEPDPARLEAAVAEGLGGLLDLYNNFAFADDGLRAKDEARIPPQERANAAAEAVAAKPLFEAIVATPDIATEVARDDIVADVANADLPADDPYADQVRDQSNRTRRNFVAGTLDWARKTLASPKAVGKAMAIGTVTGASGVIGKAAMTGIVGYEYAPLMDFIATNAALFSEYVVVAYPSYSHLPDLIETIRALWSPYIKP